ncbi:MAG: methyltransferase [Ignisphaera sp.]|uniref:Methyltransferase small domain-containing protein n=1 Tax=Ignisphaera aggregans TaxID=334771 RepID=A0A7J3N0K4_9CREN
MEEESVSTCARGYRYIGYFIEENMFREERIDEVVLMVTERVYKPSHDSYILASTLYEVLNNNELRRNLVLLEIGSGTGYISIRLCMSIYSNPTKYVIAIDIDPYAIYSSWLSTKINGMDMYIDVVQCDSASCIRSNSIDIVYFNPPYLPVCDDIPEAIAWNGGKNGTEIWREFFNNSLRMCRDRCRIVFLFSSLQNLEEVLEHIQICEYIELHQCQSFFYETLCSMVVECRQ